VEPFISIIVPTYNRPDALVDCVRSVAQLTYPLDRFELLIVDDGSSTPPGGRVKQSAGPTTVRWLSQPHGGPARARNLGASQARGGVLVFVDDDCRVPPDFLCRVSAHIRAAPNTGIGGQTINVLDNVYSTASQVHVEYLYRHYNAAPGRARFFSSNNLALPAEEFRRIGGFDDRFMTGEDRELCDRWLNAGFALKYCPDVRVYHAHDLSLRSFWSQHFNYGRGAFRFRQRRAERLQSRITLESWAFYLNLLRCHSPHVTRWRRLPVNVLLALSQVANAAGFLWERAATASDRRV
jgi:GT2 family glycosyltransferase